ncbi:MAG: hypothetical protein LBL26_08095 [Peptococcaceae bacterium]|nr:hypothetical protein [Peptococcaceae bacterium]
MLFRNYALATHTLHIIIVDDAAKKFAIVLGGLYKNKQNNQIRIFIYKYSDLIEAEYTENGNKRASTEGALIGAAVGGAIGALFGAIASKGKVVMEMRFRINDLQNPTISLGLLGINALGKSDDVEYKSAYYNKTLELAEEMIGTLVYIQSQA